MHASTREGLDRGAAGRPQEASRRPLGVRAAHWLSAGAFLGFGLACLLTDSMAADFERFGLAPYRALVGVLQTLGALGLLLGTRFRRLVAPSAAGLALLMAGGVLVRIRAGDDLVAMAPAALFLAANVAVFLDAVGVRLAPSPRASARVSGSSR